MDSDGVPTEARLTQGLTHPSIVRMLAYKLLRNSRRDSLDGQQVPAHVTCKSDELWLIQEFCDRGSVQVLPAHFHILRRRYCHSRNFASVIPFSAAQNRRSGVRPCRLEC